MQLFASTDSTSTVEQPVDNHISAEDKLISVLQTELENTNAQLKETTSQLKETTSMLRDEQQKNTTLQEQILKLSNEFSDIAKQSNVLLSQSQQISAKLLTPPPEPEPTVTEKKNILSRFKKRNRS